jgi:uncharacterized protein (DUF1501 family)
LVVIELRGGLDGLAALQPTNDARLARVRPNLVRERSQLLTIADDCGLHPRLVQLAARYENQQLGIWRGVGHDEPNLSHFESRDYWDEGRVAPLRSGSGWLGVYGEELEADPLAMLAIGDGALPGSLRGAQRRPPAVRGLTGLSFRVPKDAPGRAEALERMLAASGGDGEREFLARAALETADAGRRLGAAEKASAADNWPRTRLGTDLSAVAAVIDANLPTRVLHVVQNGYDTHADQNRSLERLLAELDGALGAFLAHLEREGRLDEVLVMTTSEFGRRVAESGDGGSSGTDHGTAGVQFFAGGRVHAGMFGPAPNLGQLDASGNLAAGVDFRRLYAGVLAHWFKSDAQRVLGPGFEPEQIVLA